MNVLYLVILITTFVAVAVGVKALLPSPSEMYELRSRTAGRAEAATIKSPLFKVFWPLLAAIAPHVSRLGSARYREEKARELPLAGLPPVLRVDHIIALKVLMALFVPLVAAQILPLVWNPALFLLVGALGYKLPDRMITEQRRLREQRILRAMPSAVDMLTLAVEAGLDFLAALQRVADKGPSGPLREEITTILNDIRLGDTRAGALKAFARRIDIPEVASFVGILVQAERLGASIGSVLRAQADRMRTERFQRAEREGAKASQKLLVPLAVFIFPAVMLVIGGPVALSFLYGE